MATAHGEETGPKSDNIADYDSDGKQDVHTASSADYEVQTDLKYQYDDSRKLGITSSVFVILNKMIGTGIFSTPSGIFAATGSVGVSLFLWVIGGILTFAGLSAFVEFGLAVRALLALTLLHTDGSRYLVVVARRITSSGFTVILSYS